MLLYQILAKLYMEKYKKVSSDMEKKYQLKHGRESLNDLMGHILYQHIQDYFHYILRNLEKRLVILQ